MTTLSRYQAAVLINCSTAHLHRLARSGAIPGVKVGRSWVFFELYEASVTMAPSEAELLPTLRNLVERTRIENLTYAWVEALVDRLKASGRAPSTILKRVGGLARVVDWAMRRKLVNFEANPFRLIPRGYCSQQIDRNKAWEGERDRRLEPGEEEVIRKVLQPHEALLFDMALETAMRLSEMLTLRWSDIDLSQRTIFLNRTKNDSRRQVPVSSVLLKLLQPLPKTSEFVFETWWNGGDLKARKAATL